MEINIINMGTVEYQEALNLQEYLLEKRQKDQINDTLILLEHPPVITLGRRGKESNILAGKDFLESRGVKVYNISRGGDVTYHGPGQITGYIIMDLKKSGGDIRKFVGKIQDVFIELLMNEFEINAHSGENTYTGVWVDNEKITAIGISVHHGVTMHGFAFNVNTNLDHFKWINPCGITDKGVTSLKKLTGKEQDINYIKELATRYFCKVFDKKPVIIPSSEIKDLNPINRGLI